MLPPVTTERVGLSAAAIQDSVEMGAPVWVSNEWCSTLCTLTLILVNNDRVVMVLRVDFSHISCQQISMNVMV